MVILLDTNILLDYILKREPFYQDARQIMELCSQHTTDGCIALHTVTTLWYLLRKQPEEVRRMVLREICELLQVAGTTHEEVLKAINMTDFKDFEDCVQSKCAKTAGVQYIVTRNVRDYSSSEIPALTPQDFIAMK